MRVSEGELSVGEVGGERVGRWVMRGWGRWVVRGCGLRAEGR